MVEEIAVEEKLYICERCGFQAINSRSLATHEGSCSRRPSPEQLWRDYEAGYTPHKLRGVYKAHDTTIRRWFEEAGVPVKQPHATRRAHEHLKIYPGYAPMYKKRKQDGCPCEAGFVCRITVPMLAWMLCECPDQTQKEALERQGFDFLQFTTELWARYPELWQERKKRKKLKVKK